VTVSISGLREDGAHSPSPAQGATHLTLSPMHVVLVDRDELFRDTFRRGLSEYDIEVTSFATRSSALSYLSAERGCDVALEALQTPEAPEPDFLPQLRRVGIQVPVIILTEAAGPAGEIYEYSALTRGAADVVDKSRGLRIIAKRIELVARRSQTHAAAVAKRERSRGAAGLALEDHLALWRGRRVPLTLTEFRIVRLLAAQSGDYVSYRQIYDLVHGKNFLAGRGIEGHRTNVRSVIRRIRQKFCAIDGAFAAIENSPNRGYRWRPAAPRDDTERHPRPN